MNGQAPPGTKSLASLGKWRCFGCGALNGEEDEAAKAVKEMKDRIEDEQPTSPNESKIKEEPTDGEGDLKEIGTDDEAEDDDSVEEMVEVEAKPKRGRPKGLKNKA